MAGLTRTFKITCPSVVILICTCSAAIAVPLWEIEGTSNQIRLLGSIHFLRAEDYPLPPAIDEAYQEADVLVMELVLDAISPAEILQVQQKLAIDPRGRSLSDLIGASAYRKARSLADKIEINLDTLQPYEPWSAALQITRLRLLQLGFDGSYGIDATMTRKARADGKPVRGLETLEEQLRTLDTLPARTQKRFLLHTLKNAGAISDDLDKILAAWREGDSNMLNSLLLEGFDDLPEVYDQLLVQRNRRWTKEIIDMTNDSQDYLIIVGALHLVGDDSVQSMLDQAGIQTRQIH